MTQFVGGRWAKLYTKVPPFFSFPSSATEARTASVLFMIVAQENLFYAVTPDGEIHPNFSVLDTA